MSGWCRRRAVMVPHWREGLTTDVYRDIVEVVADAVGPMQAACGDREDRGDAG